MKRVCTHINKNGYQVADWYWQVREHHAKHHSCHPLDNGLCAVKVLRYENWNGATEQWELEPMINAATPEQIQVLEKQVF